MCSRTLALLLLAGVAARADYLSDAGVSQALKMENFVTGLGPVTDFRFLPDGRIVITEKTGAVKVRRTDGMVVTAGTFMVDTASEKGLLGVEVHPEFATNGILFFYYSAASNHPIPGTNPDRHRVVSIVLKADNTLDMASERILVRGLIGPANHDGGGLAIGPDGKLYIGVGDTGCNCMCGPGAADNTYATCLTNGNGKILRVNLDGTIPDDNPLSNESAATACGPTCTSPVNAGSTGAPRKDIWAWGFRNPWRLWFDPKNGNLWVGDVGEITFEELNLVRKGKHYGWPYREGAAGGAVSSCGQTTPQSGDCVDPVYYCRHGGAAGGIDGQCTSINGGVIVDSCHWPDAFRGQYFFGDNANGYLYSLKLNATRDAVAGPNPRTLIGRIGTPNPPVPISFQVGPDGDLYVGIYVQPGQTAQGRIVKISPVNPIACDGGTGAGGGGGSAGGGNGAGGGGIGELDGGSSAKGCGCISSGGSMLPLILLGSALLFAAAMALRRRI